MALISFIGLSIEIYVPDKSPEVAEDQWGGFGIFVPVKSVKVTQSEGVGALPEISREPLLQL